MKQAFAVLLCVALAAPGCASAHFSRASIAPRQMTVSPTDPAVMAEYVQKLPAGSRVRVDTMSGRTVRGTLIKASDDELVVQRNTRLPLPPEALPMTDVSRVVVEPASSNGRLMAVGAAIGAGAAIGIVWLVAIVAFGD